ncbi:DUF6194 family protein [Clostridioides difficile]|uniref:DUF6194 family protein n=1 Tax=Clostridioides difficile TaxID=1496 RepID=UPI000BB37BA3|nr:DUF6194 family protein [Clostridioides difficile]
MENDTIKADDILNYCLSNLDDVVLMDSWGERAIYYNPNGVLKRGVYVLTIKEKDSNNDKGSLVSRPNVYRVNIGLRKETFIEMFGYIPKRPGVGQIVDMDFDFTKLDTIMPHPIYSWMGWICVLSPTEKTFENFKTLIGESYNFAKQKFKKRKNK